MSELQENRAPSPPPAPASLHGAKEAGRCWAERSWVLGKLFSSEGNVSLYKDGALSTHVKYVDAITNQP